MRIPIVILLVINILSAQAGQDVLPLWITKGPMSDSSFHYVICSHDGIDPEEARQIAESKCLASAAKLGGVNVKLTQKTVQSLTGSDSSEVAEIQPLEAKIKCEWTDRFLEKIKDGFRVWLRCKVDKKEIYVSGLQKKTDISNLQSIEKYYEATLVVNTLPQADRIILDGFRGPKVIEPTANVVNIVISTLDQKLEIKKAGYKTTTIELPHIFKQGERIRKSIVLEKE